MKKLVELSLDSGWRVRCRRTSPLAVRGSISDSRLWIPRPPKVKVKTKAGEEEVDAPIDSPEYEEYVARVQEISRKQEVADRNFHYGYGVVDWAEDRKGKIPDREFSKEPPKGWEPDELMCERLGTDDPRLVWIMSELIITLNDIGMVDKTILSMDLRPLEEGEVRAAEDSFPGDVEEATA